MLARHFEAISDGLLDWGFPGVADEAAGHLLTRKLSQLVGKPPLFTRMIASYGFGPELIAHLRDSIQIDGAQALHRAVAPPTRLVLVPIIEIGGRHHDGRA